MIAAEVVLVLSTFGSAEEARQAGRTVVEERLAACANLVPGVESIYRWEGEVQASVEVLVVFKTTAARYEELEARLRALHSYEVPEIVSFPLSAGFEPYLQWVTESCGPASGEGE
jgi:periplasmic divalent cation tolerance protein